MQTMQAICEWAVNVKCSLKYATILGHLFVLHHRDLHVFGPSETEIICMDWIHDDCKLDFPAHLVAD